MKIVLTDSVSIVSKDIDLSIFEQFGDFIIYEDTSKEELLERVKDANVILCNKTYIGREIIESCKNLEYIGIFATGFNNIDLEAASENNIVVSNAGSYSTNAVAQQVFAYILNHYMQLDKYSDYVNKGKWKESKTFAVFDFPTHELADKNIGIIGYGNIGKKVAQIAKAFDMNVYVYSRRDPQDKNVKFLDLKNLLAVSDIVTIHTPLNEQTRHMFNDDTFKLMKRNAILINTARGSIIKEESLKKALEENIISAAAIDVLKKEPMLPDSILFNVENLLITPHTAWAPIETRQRLVKIVAKNLENFIKGNPSNVVNP